MNRSQLQELSEVRILEARSLMSAGLFDGAYYLAGYSVECALKACIAKRTKEFDFPDKDLVQKSWTHRLGELLRHSQLAPALEIAIEADRSLESEWNTVQRWSEESRYERKRPSDAQALLTAIESHKGGVLPWIRLHW